MLKQVLLAMMATSFVGTFGGGAGIEKRMTSTAGTEGNDCELSVRIASYKFSGRSAALRAACAVGGITFEDFIKSPPDTKDKTELWWSEPEMTILGAGSAEMAELPIPKIAHSNSALRYVGKITPMRLYPDNAVQAALVDEVMEWTEEVINLATEFYGHQAEAGKSKSKSRQAEAVKKEMSVRLKRFYAKFEKMFKQNEGRGAKNGFIVGDLMTVADLKFFYHFMYLSSFDYNIEQHTKIYAFMNKMQTDENIKKFDAQSGGIFEGKFTIARYGTKNVCGEM